MKTKTKKLYQKVDVSKSKRFGNQNTNSINVIVNPRDEDDDDTPNRNMMKITPSLTSQLNVLGGGGGNITPQAVNQVQQEALRQGEAIDGQSIRQANQELQNQEDFQAMQTAVAQQVQEQVVAGNTGQIMNRLGQIGGQLIAQQLGGGELAQQAVGTVAPEVMNALGRLGGEIMGNIRSDNRQNEEVEDFLDQSEQIINRNNQLEDSVRALQITAQEEFERENQQLRNRILEQDDRIRTGFNILQHTRDNNELLEQERNVAENRNQQLLDDNRELMEELKSIEAEANRLSNVVAQEELSPPRFFTPGRSPLMGSTGANQGRLKQNWYGC